MGDIQTKYERARHDAQLLLERIRRTRDSANDATLQEVAARESVPRLYPAPSIRTRRILRGHQSKVYSLSWANDSKLVTASHDAKLIVWNTLTGHSISAIDLRSPWVMTCTFSPDGQRIAAGGLENAASIYQFKQGYTESSNSTCVNLLGHKAYISCLRFLNSRSILSASGDCSCILWDIERQTPLRLFQEHSSDVMAISIAPDNSAFVSGGCDASAILWDIRWGRSVQAFISNRQQGDINTTEFFPSGMAFAIGAEHSSCTLFDIRADTEMHNFQTPTGDFEINSIAFSKSGRILFAGCDDKIIRMWDTLYGTYLGELVDHEGSISCIQMHKDGYCLASASWDTSIRLWA